MKLGDFLGGMMTTKACKIFSLFIGLLFITLSARSVVASEPEARPPIKFKVGIYLLNCGKLDIVVPSVSILA